MKSMDVIKTVASKIYTIIFTLIALTTPLFLSSSETNNPATDNTVCTYEWEGCLCPDGKTPGYCTFNEKNVLYCECNHVFPD